MFCTEERQKERDRKRERKKDKGRISRSRRKDRG